MATKIAINGFGRIGRCITRALHQRGGEGLELVAINDLTDTAMLAHLLQYDSVHRTFDAKVEVGDGFMTVGNQKIKTLAERDPEKLPWGDLGVDIVLECTGFFVSKEGAGKHLAGGAKNVVISAPGKGVDQTIVYGVNHDKYDPANHRIISNGSCTTNCLAPPTKVLLDSFGIVSGLLTTVHSYTNDQALLDVPHRKGNLRRARAAAQNMVPSTTGAAKAIYDIIPALKGKFDGMAMRVPTMDVSIVDLTVTTEKNTTVEEVNAAMKKAANEGPMKDVMDYTDVELVSGDYIGNPASSTVDGTLTTVIGGNMVKVFAWYDNEWGFSNRMIDLAKLVAQG
ncbi:MAG: type I glyceraldehyde-3-phosphate dehydrogenase [Polyangiaceae bacterium]